VRAPARPSPAALAAAPRRRRRLLGLLLAALAGSGLGAGCAQGDRPYRFSSPLIGGAELPSVRDPDARHEAGPSRDPRDPAVAPRDRPPRAPRPKAMAMAPVRRALEPAAVARHLPPKPPAPRRGAPPDPPRTLGAKADPGEPRSWVGVRDDSDPLSAVLALCARANPRCPQPGDELALLRQRDAWLPASTPFAVGDLLRFDRVGLDNGEQIFALVTARQARGVFELAYLAAGVWRRGLIDPMRPRLHRDGSGAVVNTYLRHHRAKLPEGTRFLSGELLAGVLPLGSSEPARPRLARW
jgi:hypothetical protein